MTAVLVRLEARSRNCAVALIVSGLAVASAPAAALADAEVGARFEALFGRDRNTDGHAS